jgi:hypothetical protein
VSSWARDAAEAVHWELSVDEVSWTLDPTAGKPSRDIVESVHRATAQALDQGRRSFVLMLDEAQVPVDDRRPCTGSIGNRSGSPVGCVAPAWRGCSMGVDGDVSPPSQRRVTPIEYVPVPERS